MIDDIENILFCGSFDGETDRLSKFANLKVYNTGVGFLDSVFNLQRYLNKNTGIKLITFLGSAGAYIHSQKKIGDLVFSNKFVYKDIAEVKNMVKVPTVINKHILTNTDLRFDRILPRSKFKEGIINSTNYITLIDLEHEELIDSLYEVDLENMEAFPIAYVANRLSIPFIGFFYVTNFVGSKGSEDWNSNWRYGSNVLQEEILKLIM